MTEPVYSTAEMLAAANQLQASMTELKDEIRELHTYGRRNRHLIWALAASLVFDLLLSVALFFTFVVAGDARDAAEQNRQAQIVSCESGNTARQVSANLWSYVLDTAAKDPENQTNERRQKIADFRQYMATSYAPRDCSQIGK